MALGHSCGGRSVTVVTESAKTSTRIRVGALPPVMQQKYKNIEIQKYENTKIPTMSAKTSTRIRFGAVVAVMQSTTRQYLRHKYVYLRTPSKNYFTLVVTLIHLIYDV